MTNERALLLTVARILRAKIRNEIYAERDDDLSALDEMLAPYEGIEVSMTEHAVERRQ